MSNPEYRWFTSVRPGISYRPGSEEQVSKGLGDVMNSVKEFTQQNPNAVLGATVLAATHAALAAYAHMTEGEKPEPSDPGPTNQRVLGPDDVPTRDVPHLRRNRGPSELTEGERADQKFATSIQEARNNAKRKPSTRTMSKSVNKEDAQKSLLVSADFLETSVARLLKNLSYDQHE